MFKKCLSILILSMVIADYIGCSKPENKQIGLSPSTPSKDIILGVTGPIYTTFELNAKYETIPRDKPVWVIAYIISEQSSISGIFKICSLNAFTTEPEKLKGGIFNIDPSYFRYGKRIYVDTTGLVVGKKFAFKIQMKNKGMGGLIETAPNIQLIK